MLTSPLYRQLLVDWEGHARRLFAHDATDLTVTVYISLDEADTPAKISHCDLRDQASQVSSEQPSTVTMSLISHPAGVDHRTSRWLLPFVFHAAVNN